MTSEQTITMSFAPQIQAIVTDYELDTVCGVVT